MEETTCHTVYADCEAAREGRFTEDENEVMSWAGDLTAGRYAGVKRFNEYFNDMDVALLKKYKKVAEALLKECPSENDLMLYRKESLHLGQMSTKLPLLIHEINARIYWKECSSI